MPEPCRPLGNLTFAGNLSRGNGCGVGLHLGMQGSKPEWTSAHPAAQGVLQASPKHLAPAIPQAAAHFCPPCTSVKILNLLHQPMAPFPPSSPPRACSPGGLPQDQTLPPWPCILFTTRNPSAETTTAPKLMWDHTHREPSLVHWKQLPVRWFGGVRGIRPSPGVCFCTLIKSTRA